MKDYIDEVLDNSLYVGDDGRETPELGESLEDEPTLPGEDEPNDE